MKYFATIFWAFIISIVVSYVLTSMGNQAFNLPGALGLAALFSIAAILLGDVILKEEEE